LAKFIVIIKMIAFVFPFLAITVFS